MCHKVSLLQLAKGTHKQEQACLASWSQPASSLEKVTFAHWSLGAMGKLTRGAVCLLLLTWGSRSGLSLYSPGPGVLALPSLGL